MTQPRARRGGRCGATALLLSNATPASKRLLTVGQHLLLRGGSCRGGATRANGVGRGGHEEVSPRGALSHGAC